MSPLSIEKIHKGSRRLQEIVTILGKYQLADWLGESGPDFVHGWLQGAGGVDLRRRTTEERIRLAIEELGPTFIKLGQMLSTRPDIAGPDLAEELEALQKDVPSDAPEKIRALVEAELGVAIAERFATFEDEPLASASIAQVHTATLSTGEEVVLKVQHPDIRNDVERDLELLAFLAGLAEKHSGDLRAFQPVAMVEEFRRTLMMELDFRRELHHLQMFRENFSKEEGVHFPKPWPDHSTERVLTMERLQGVFLSERETLEEQEIDTAAIVRKGARIYLDMIFRDGFFHADPHPGNILVMDGDVIGLLDCGSASFLDESTRRDLEDIFLNVVNGDSTRLTEAVLRFGSTPPDLDRAGLSGDLSLFTAEFSNQTLETFDATRALTRLLRIVRKHRIVLRRGIAVLLKTLIELEGTSRRLDRQFSLAQLIQPYYEQAHRRRLAPDRILARLQSSLQEWERLLGTLPQDLASILRRLKEGDLQVFLRHSHLDATVNRMTVGILTASLALSASLLLAQRVPPKLWDISVPGVVVGLAAGYLGWGLLRAIRRSGGLDRDNR
jgi:ubiquinone biosynthesis protein